ncbi:aromatic ring-hydroxylating dioxygenase subunit alpha [Parasphingorhabdus sp.]|uniref:aromatic ring-hydroxylating oxygenase subunit alpha n=1 Tax=Parasphingorhabdus sp. TaxID=2709688 RepID=UPI0032EADF48
MVETLTGHNRSNGISYVELLEGDKVAPPAVYLEESPMEPGVTTVEVSRYWTKEEHDREVERLWKRVWQMTCHKDDIKNVGDTFVYDIAELSFLIVRVSEDEIKAFPNSCMHRGRAICDHHKKGQKALRCPFHGWSWELNGKLKEVPCQWDFPSVSEETHSLKEVNVGEWGGFVFINPDPDCEPLEDFLGDIDRHFQIPFERRYKAAHMIKRLPCNWKIAQEAFMESYHVVGTHPELMPAFADANSKYDVWHNMSRAMSAHGQPSPHTDLVNPDPTAFPDEKAFQSFIHPISKHKFERLEENRVKVSLPSGKSGIFDMEANYIEGDVTSADPHMCNWIGGKIAPADENMPMVYTDVSAHALRNEAAQARREEMRPAWGDMVDDISDADLVDAIFYSVFPNISPWADFNPIFYRFRPDGDNPEQSLHEVMFMVALPEGAERPEPAKCTFLDLHDDYTQATEFGSYLNKIFNQDYLNHKAMQKGVKSQPHGVSLFAQYQESKLRHFHETLNLWLDSEEAPKSPKRKAVA